MAKKQILKSTAIISLAAAMLLSGCNKSDSASSTANAESGAPAASSAPASAPAESSAPAPAPASSAGTGTETPSTTDTPALDGYNLLWSDEFNGDSLNFDIWSYDPHEPGWTNNELQEYTESTENVFVKDGKLILKAIKTEKDGADYYTSGKVKTQNKQDFTYGKVVASAKAPAGQGLWPAIWMMPTVEEKYGHWPICGEIDIMEVLGSDVKTAYSTVHYGIRDKDKPYASTNEQGKLELTDNDFASSFHEYSVEWEPGEMRWYIDGNQVLKVNDWFSSADALEDYPFPAPFNQDFYVQLNLAVGGDWPGNPDATTDFSKAEFEIDYVRVYQKDSYDTNVQKPTKPYREPLADGNLIYNGDFADAENLADNEQWTFYKAEGGAGTAEIKDNTLIITTTNPGTVDYSVQMFQPLLPMYRGKKYRISFDAKADEARNIIVCVSAPNAGWVRYFPDTTQAITTEMTTYTYEFEMENKDDNNGRLEFNLGGHGESATVYIQNVRVEFID